MLTHIVYQCVDIMISYSDFMKICEDGNIDIVNSMIRTIEPLDKSSFREYMNDGLVGACSGGHLDIVKLMIEKGAYRTFFGLEGACKGGHLNVIEFLIENGEYMWDYGLYGACEGGYLNIVEMMIEKGATYFDRGLYYACKGGNLDIIKLLIKKGAKSWNYIFGIDHTKINSNIVGLIIEKKIPIEKFYLKYPIDKLKIYKLCELGLPIDNLKDIDNFEILVKEIEDRRNVTKDVLSNDLINDLARIVAEYVIN